MSRILLRGGRVLDPATNTDKVCDILMEEGLVLEVGEKLSEEGAQVRDVSGLWVAPGFCDMHVHFREPGLEYKEDIASGGRAAVAGACRGQRAASASVPGGPGRPGRESRR